MIKFEPLEELNCCQNPFSAILKADLCCVVLCTQLPRCPLPVLVTVDETLLLLLRTGATAQSPPAGWGNHLLLPPSHLPGPQLDHLPHLHLSGMVIPAAPPLNPSQVSQYRTFHQSISFLPNFISDLTYFSSSKLRLILFIKIMIYCYLVGSFSYYCHFFLKNIIMTQLFWSPFTSDCSFTGAKSIRSPGLTHI